MMATESVTDNDNLNKEIIQWGCKYLSSHGYTLKNNLPENMQFMSKTIELCNQAKHCPT